jgi:hypothetical protein
VRRAPGAWREDFLYSFKAARRPLALPPRRTPTLPAALPLRRCQRRAAGAKSIRLSGRCRPTAVSRSSAAGCPCSRCGIVQGRVRNRQGRLRPQGNRKPSSCVVHVCSRATGKRRFIDPRPEMAYSKSSLVTYWPNRNGGTKQMAKMNYSRNHSRYMGTLVNEYLGTPATDSYDESTSSKPGRPGKAKKRRPGKVKKPSAGGRRLKEPPASIGPDTPSATKQGKAKTALPKATKQIIPRAKKSAWSPCRLCGRPVLKQQAQRGGLCVDCLTRKRRQTIVGPTPRRKRRKS